MDKMYKMDKIKWAWRISFLLIVATTTNRSGQKSTVHYGNCFKEMDHSLLSIQARQNHPVAARGRLDRKSKRIHVWMWRV